MERLPNRYPKISQSHKVPLYKGLSLFYPKLRKFIVLQTISAKNYELELNKRARSHTSKKRVKPVRIQEIQLLVAFFHQKIWIYEENIVLLHSQTSNNGEVAQMVRAQDS